MQHKGTRDSLNDIREDVVHSVFFAAARSPVRCRQWRRSGLLAALAAVTLLVGAPPASADITVDSAVCLDGAAGTLSIVNPGVTWPDLPVVTWTTSLPSACTAANGQLSLVRGTTEYSVVGSSRVVPQAGPWTLRLHTSMSSKDLASVTVSIGLPSQLMSGPADVTITGNDAAERSEFASAVQTAGSTVRVAGNLNLDLSGLDGLPVAAGVQIIGDRSVVRSGPRLFTTTFPRKLFVIGSYGGGPSHGVRISGIRLDGGMSDDAFSAVGTDDANGIEVYSSAVQLDHNEFYHWRGAAVSIFDGNGNNAPTQVGVLNQGNASDMWVHDNYIHHNQHPSSAACGGDDSSHANGYGVAVFDGAYATIERNVFDYNRHSIAGDGSWGTGYFARDNLILQHGGDHIKCGVDTGGLLSLVENPFRVFEWAGVRIASSDGIYHTHAIDMHGQDTCRNGPFTGNFDLSDYNCGVAGEYMEVSYNTVLYTAGNAIHLRGYPAAAPGVPAGTKVGMNVTHNVFAHSAHDGGFVTPGAFVHNDTGLTETDNTLGLDTFGERRYCDFDGDGTQDPFIATGVTWWFASSAIGGRWTFLNRSPVRVADVTLADYDGDLRCDVNVGGQVVLNTDPQPYALPPGSLSTTYGAAANVNLAASGGAPPYVWSVTGLPAGFGASSNGHISGTASGDASTVTAVVTDANGRFSSTTFTWTITATVPSVTNRTQAAAQQSISSSGLTSSVSTVNNCVDPGTVRTQNPAAGTAAPLGSVVRITVSTCTGNGGGGGGGGDGNPRQPM